MSLSIMTLAFDAIVIGLLGAMIFYAVKLNRRLTTIRSEQASLLELMARFNDATARAEAAAVRLKSIGVETEAALKGQIEQGRALRDDLTFLIERGGGQADHLSLVPRERKKTAKREVRSDRATVSELAAAQPRSEAERNLLKALREAR